MARPLMENSYVLPENYILMAQQEESFRISKLLRSIQSHCRYRPIFANIFPSRRHGLLFQLIVLLYLDGFVLTVGFPERLSWAPPQCLIEDNTVSIPGIAVHSFQKLWNNLVLFATISEFGLFIIVTKRSFG